MPQGDDMPTLDPQGSLTPVLSNHVSRLGERLAEMQGRFTAELTSVKEDNARTRDSLHAIRNQLQQSIDAEHRCATELAALSIKVTLQTDQFATTVAALSKQFENVASDVKILTAAQNQAHGGWWVSTKIAAVFAAIITPIITAIWWLLQHLSVAPIH